MSNWIQYLIVALIVLAAAWFIVKKVRHAMSGQCSCGCGGKKGGHDGKGGGCSCGGCH